jgi:hypothetical protein
MFRREFLKASLIGSTTVLNSTQGQPGASSFLGSLVQENDRVLSRLLLLQERTAGHPWVGALVDAHSIHSAPATAHFIGRATAALCSQDSRFLESQQLLESAELAIRYLLRAQHPDGTIDLHSTNFNSPPDTAFAVEPLAAAAALLRNTSREAMETLANELEVFLRRAGESLIVGGIHTPNHRWVVCGALAQLNDLYPDDRYVARVDEWLAEGIDIDADGQYTERSTSIYSATCDRVLVTTARLLQKPELLKAVRRNLEMTRFLVHPNGEVVTEISRRQDQYKPGSLRRYYLPYRYMAVRDQDGDFAAVARLIEELQGKALSNELLYLLENPELRRGLPSPGPLPNSYIRHYSTSGLVRFREAETSVTVISDNSTFFSMHQGKVVLQALRFASAFFGKGQFKGTLTFDERTCELVQHLQGPYYQPLPSRTIPHGTWPPGNRMHREQTEVQELTSRATVTVHQGRCDCRIEITGTERVPVSVELSFRKGGTLVGVEQLEDITDAYCLVEGFGEYRLGSDRIRFGPGQMDHRWVQLRGAEPKVEGLSVYLTGFTPFRQTIQIFGTSG